ncbi:MAG TPA: hypothetical protein VMI31_07395 [Fimbriimonadaceae bacterium]|nr:hypothetical protein [Fimbriimonadaceae bacterium]
MEERGFDALQHGMGAVVLVASTILLTLIIIAGGLIFRYLEIQYRREHPKEAGREPSDQPHA